MSGVDGKLVWTGTLNEQALAGRKPPSARFYDTTLRDGEQSVGVLFDPEQTLEIAKLLDGLGVGRIEAGFPRVSEDERIAIAEIMKAGLKAEIWGLARAMIENVDAVADLGMRYSVVGAPISDPKLGALGVTREQVLERIRKAGAHAVARGLHVAFFGVDSTRADLGFFELAYQTARDAGAKEFVIVDTIAIATPEAVSFLIGRIREWLGPDAVLHFHGHNDFGLATGLRRGGAAGRREPGARHDRRHRRTRRQRQPAGDRAHARAALRCPDRLSLRPRARAASQRLREIAGYQLEPWKSVVGENLFVRETGAVAAQFHMPEAIEPYSSTLLATRRGIVLGKKSGVASSKLKCEELGLAAPASLHARLLEDVKALALRKRRRLSDDEFRELVRAAS